MQSIHGGTVVQEVVRLHAYIPKANKGRGGMNSEKMQITAYGAPARSL
jgi:hypothetical protein